MVLFDCKDITRTCFDLGRSIQVLKAAWEVIIDDQSCQQPLSVSETWKNIPDTISVSFGTDNTRSVDLTMDSLKAEVARLNAVQLVSGIATYKGRAVPEMSDNNALTLCATHIKFERNTGEESKNDETETQYDQTKRRTSIRVGCSSVDSFLVS